ncbi:MAG: hypothetical protein JJU01_10480 [Alkalibacterium sp.]|nr:hypothetical protein [Alkalibacterium sp.]
MAIWAHFPLVIEMRKCAPVIARHRLDWRIISRSHTRSDSFRRPGIPLSVEQTTSR